MGRSASSTPAPQDESAYTAVLPTFVPSPIPNFFATRNHPVNKSGYRYIACGPSPSSLPQFPLYRTLASPPTETVRFSWEDRSPYVYISQDANAISTDKGFRTARANIPIREGSWYFEVTVDRGIGDVGQGGKTGPHGPHVRIGLGRREAPLNAPVGFDGHSYGLRDTSGEKVHLSVPKTYGDGFGTGDVIGVLLRIPARPEAGKILTVRDPGYDASSLNPAQVVRKRVAIRYKGQLYFEASEYAASKEMEDLAFKTADPIGFAKAALEAEQKLNAKPPPGKKKAPAPPAPPPARPLPTLPGSELRFHKNGADQGIAFADLYDWLPLQPHAKRANASNSKQSASAAASTARENHHDDGTLGYYPMVSVFGGAIASINAGPQFRYSPSLPEGSWRPLIERYPEYLEEQAFLDDIDDEIALERFQANAEQYLAAAPVSKAKGGKAGRQHQTKKKTGLSQQLELATPDSRSASTSPAPTLPSLARERLQTLDGSKPQVLLEMSAQPAARTELEHDATEMHAEGVVKMEVD